MDTELRFISDELRVLDAADVPPKIVGYAAMFNSLSLDLGGFREKIAPGAFREAIAGNREVLALMHHDAKMIVGRRSAGTLTIAEDGQGLAVEIFPGNTTTGRDAIEMVRRKDIKGMSFRFNNARSTWERNGNDKVRTIISIGELMEVTLTGIPAYESTTAEVRSAIDRLETEATATPRRNYADRCLRLAAIAK